MLTKSIADTKKSTDQSVTKKVITEEEALDIRYQELYAELKKLIQALPKNCIYKVQAKAVLDHVDEIKKHIVTPVPTECLISTLKQTIDILTPLQPRVISLNDVDITLAYDDIDLDDDTPEENIHENYFAQLQQYEEFARSLKRQGGLQILSGILCALLAVICLVIYISTLVIYTGTIIVSATLSPFLWPLFLTILAFENIISAIEMFCFIFLAVSKICNGSASIALGNLLQNLQTKVREEITITQPETQSKDLVSSQNPFMLGLSDLENNKVATALTFFTQVPQSDPNYKNAQNLKQIYSPDHNIPGSPTKNSVLRLNPEYHEKDDKSLAEEATDLGDKKPPAEDWRQVRDRLGRNSPEYAQYVLNKNAELDDMEREQTVQFSN